MSSASPSTTIPPREGMVATLRNRRGLITAVEPFDAEGTLHLVTVEYSDLDGSPSDTVLWEREVGAQVFAPNALPAVTDDPPMPLDAFDALIRAARWQAVHPALPYDRASGDQTPPQALSSPLHGAVQVEDYQLVPVARAMQMPRVSLLLADDVGLGKTIEAGLVLNELLVQRRIRRVLILSPASLRHQWQDEMQRKFSLPFEVIDRAWTTQLQRRLGIDANPWRAHHRAIASYHYLRQPDVLEQFLATCERAVVAARLPWDLLIVDEAHNLMPATFGTDSDLSRMLRQITPYFEHKLFLTATPHNGHTRSFSGLLEQLDPVRFNRTAELTEQQKRRVRQVMVRRLKDDINQLDTAMGRDERFARRHLEPRTIPLTASERELSNSYAAFRAGVHAIFAQAKRSEQIAGSFAVEILHKRLLSGPATFAESWWRFREAADARLDASLADMSAARLGLEDEAADDAEAESRQRNAAATAGAWLADYYERLRDSIDAIDKALATLGLPRPTREVADTEEHTAPRVPAADSRFDSLVALIDDKLRDGRAWRDDERLICFTEYKTSLDYVHTRLRGHYNDPNGHAIRVLYGGMDDAERERIKAAFNDPADPVRVLVATDAASEGQNLQQTARYLLHWDIPWNPSRLEQRNGRVDRHGQARDITVHYFTAEDALDLQFLAKVAGKVDQMRSDLGSMGRVLETAVHRGMATADAQAQQDLLSSIDADAKVIPSGMRSIDELLHSDELADSERHLHEIDQLRAELDLSPKTLQATLEQAMQLQGDSNHRRLEGPDQTGRFRLASKLGTAWTHVVNDTLRLRGASSKMLGALPSVVFDPAFFMREEGPRRVFRDRDDTTLVHAGHPMIHTALARFAQARFPSDTSSPGATLDASRWSVTRGDTGGADALVRLTIEELAVNELREPIHQWVRTIELPVSDGALAPSPRGHQPAAQLRERAPIDAREDQDQAIDIWDDVSSDLKARVVHLSVELTRTLRERLDAERPERIAEEVNRFDERIGEVRAQRGSIRQSLERERRRLEESLSQLSLSEAFDAERRQRLEELEEELGRNYDELLDWLPKEGKRITDEVLPKRYSLRGDAQVLPVAIEIVLPEAH